MTIETIRQLIASSRPRRRLFRGSTLVLLGLSVLLGGLWADPDLFSVNVPLVWLLPQAVLVVLIVVVVRNMRRQRILGRLMERAFEAVQLRQWEQARETLTELLGRPLRYANARAELLMALAAAEEADQNYDASQCVYESLLEESAADPLQLHTARVALAGAMLRTGQVTDAVTLIERLERAGLPDPLRAQVELLALFREVTMGQAEASVARADERRELFRQFMSTRAGYGYGLLAAAFDRSGQPERARSFWHDATLLVASSDLLLRFGELGAAAGKYPSAEMTL